MLAVPVAVAVAVLKYRLYDIDRVISRTLGYAIVTGLLVGVYAGLVLLATQVLGLHTPVAVAAATPAAAALFSPIRLRVQRMVDRRFNRARYDAEATVAAFAARLKDAVDLDTVRDDLASMVQTALEPAHLRVWTSQRDRVDHEWPAVGCGLGGPGRPRRRHQRGTGRARRAAAAGRPRGMGRRRPASDHFGV